MQKKILLLGGSHGQLRAIKMANEIGMYTILCDYLPDNPGREYANEYFMVSTTDISAVEEIAQKHNIDYIFAYASDPAAYTSAVIAERLKLPGNSASSVRILSEKNTFRNFQLRNGANHPRFRTIMPESGEESIPDDFPFPAVLKPVDSSDSKGVFKINSRKEIRKRINESLVSSRSKKLIIEEFISGSKGEVHGDAFFRNGEMVFCMLGDRLYHSESHPLKPSTDVYPSRLSKQTLVTIKNEVSRLVGLSGYKNGAVNIEARIDGKGDLYVMEIGPRSGGAMTPWAIYLSTGFDMLKATFDYFEGKKYEIPDQKQATVICYGLHTNKQGIFKEFRMPDYLKVYNPELYLYVKPGDRLKPFREPASTIGILHILYEDFDDDKQIKEKLYYDVQKAIITY